MPMVENRANAGDLLVESVAIDCSTAHSHTHTQPLANKFHVPLAPSRSLPCQTPAARASA